MQFAAQMATTGLQAEKASLPFTDLRAQFNTIKDEIARAVSRVMENGQFILGQEVESFENAMAAFVGTQFAAGCASGSDALLLALLALGIGPGDEVITTPFTFVATVGAVARVGAKPVFVDIQPDTFNLDPDLLERAINERTRAIIPVHLFGLAADLDRISATAKEHRLAVIEDVAQAIGGCYRGAGVGSVGTLGCFSFFPSKNLGGMGDGGLVTTDDPSLAKRLRLLRVHGSSRRYHYEEIGINSRLDALQAAILMIKLAHLKEWTEARQQKAEQYCTLFEEYGLHSRLKLPSVPHDGSHVYNQFVIRCTERDSVRDFLLHRGIPTEIYYPLPLHLQPAFAYLQNKYGQFPEAESASREVLALPIYPELSGDHQSRVVRAIGEFYGTGC
jgi:dTDP-4-amino-4,6-dideoxygalactose transaminase